MSAARFGWTSTLDELPGDVVITSVEPTCGAGKYWEHVVLSFARVKQEYIVQSNIGGSAGTVTAAFDIKENIDR
ncbi:hypothetical protein [Paraburkholderia sp. J63]|uniref:hypothetical protein n=1 Tax=Paraburkholderia sp. J63 TaxID=2805434 RepID=UPI002ABD6F30|nr:hypothetical protein [Paraburkholderia sp. J63]